MSRRVLVTGASRGIGRAIAVAFAERGERVAVHYGSDRGEGETTLHALKGEGHVLVSGDLGDPAAAKAVVQSAVEGLGGVDVLVNNAAIAPGDSNRHDIASVDYEEWQRVWRSMVDVDLLGAANVTYCVARHLIERRAGGSIVNVGSRGAYRGEPSFPAYGAAKAGLHAFGQSMAVALAPHGIAVASVAPGFIGTERQQAMLDDAVRGQSPFGRVGTPEEVAAAVVHLSSPEAVWSSGAVLDLNGASYLR
ncbi:SDR family NAD(P)-dependent oxidoreductase [Actinoplanes sp. Pm04-4]|uniref:SDR family NAD(P)-dependent oxidoreductase n=1 Tax=Paractinoplanes pyxinae TaxID=2997416 RepID=A0ABT4AXR4_9ACTN|nr:SDR family oxidoreductase [Actinoplanes pyxinae]MCY1139042.1 SDR family NAD(P)-dependent oxidoreductase [Actinoplanes pyxinae]